MTISRRATLRILGGIGVAGALLPSLTQRAFAAVGVTTDQVRAAIQGRSHPFLLIDASAFQSWPTKSTQEPWAGMLADAINDSTSFRYTYAEAGQTWEHLTAPGVPVVTTAEQMRSASLVNATVTASALVGYLANPANRSTHLDVLERMLRHFGQYVGPYLGRGSTLQPGTVGGWETHVTPSSCFVDMVMVLDIAQADLQQRGTLAAHEATVRSAADWLWSSAAADSFVWASGLHGARLTWSLYAQEYDRAAQAINDYVAYQEGSVEPDGVFLGGPYYANERYVPPQAKRDSKLHAMDMLQHLGLVDFYGDSRWKNFYEWVFGYSFSPIVRQAPDDGTWTKDYYTFGDTPIAGRTWNQTYENDINGASADIYKAHRFGAAAFADAGDTVGNPATPMGRFWHFVYYDRPFPGSRVIPSRVFPSGHAVLREPVDAPHESSQALSASMVCPTRHNTVGGHMRFDVNSIHLTAYGEHIVRGSGYPGYTPMVNNPSYWLHNRSHNTVMVNRVQHSGKSGTGFVPSDSTIPETILAGAVEYVSAGSGPALPNATHNRSLVQVATQNGIGGYWLVLDEIDSAPTNSSVQISHHPSSTTTAEQAAGMLFTARMDYRTALPQSQVDLDLLLATPPTTTSIQNGYFGRINQTPEQVQYLEAEYPATNGRCQVATVLYPRNSTVAAPAFSRISEPGMTGGILHHTQGSVTDYAWTSDDDQPHIIGGITCRGIGGIHRLAGDELLFLLSRQVTEFSTAGTARQRAKPRYSLRSHHPITVLLQRNELRLIAHQATDLSLTSEQLERIATGLGNITGIRLLTMTRTSITLQIQPGSYTLPW